LDDDVWHQVANDLDLLVRGIDAGMFPATPDVPKWQPWIDCHYCEPDGLGVAERSTEWQLKQTDPRLAPWFAPEQPDDSETGGQ
jgi:hypothetical protein